ncbi:MAG TPA: cation:proton antiporter [Bacteroidetes bacterium]|nr:cation:proton antiporter [Bacteroidota bacterium]
MIYQTILYAAMANLILAMALTLVRLGRGPASGDRVVALDLVASISMGMILVYSLFTEEAVYLDIPVLIAMVSFIGTVAISAYLKHKK